MPKISDISYAIGRPYSSIEEHKNDYGKWRTGTYVFHHGIITIYAQDDHLSMSHYKDGRGYHRTINGKRYTDIGIARMAGKFARELYK